MTFAIAAQFARPEFLAEHDGQRGAGRVFVGAVEPPAQRTHAERGKQRRRRLLDAHPPRISARAHRPFGRASAVGRRHRERGQIARGLRSRDT